MKQIILILLIMHINLPTHAAELPSSKPERVGVSSERLERIGQLNQQYVEQRAFSGIVTMVARRGKVIHVDAAGNYGLDNPKPMTADTLFRIYSMTKPVTAVAAMMLYEEGKFHLNDPISKFLPEFAGQKVLVDGELVDPKTPITMRHLLTHTAGFTYGWTPDNPVDIEYQKVTPLETKNLSEMVNTLAAIPLRFEPGTRYHYSVAFDVLGAVIERLSGMTLDKYYQQRIFKPLAMQDTFFKVPADKLHRLASDQGWDYQKNQIMVLPKEQSRDFANVSLFIGGGGLVSTVGDYMRFCQMILNGGTLNGVRLLSPKTIALMTSNKLTPEVRAEGVGQYPTIDLYPGQSMAFGYGVVTDPDLMPDYTSVGEVSWGGVAGTKFWIDKREELIGIAMVQLYQSPWPLRADFKSAVYPALTELNSQR